MDFIGVDFRIATIKNDDGSTEIYFVHIKYWDDFDLILALLKKENECEILKNDEMIYAREAELQRKDVRIILRHDDMIGNYFYTTQPEMIPLLEELAQNVVDSVKQRLKEKGLH